jgi:hypothetical protein
MLERRAATQPRSRPCVLLLDENMSSLLIAEQLRKLEGWDIQLHDSHLDRGAADHAVVDLCGRNHWGLVTCDDMRYTPETKVAMVEQRVRIFKVVCGRETHVIRITAALIGARLKMIALMKKTQIAMCAHIQLNGHVVVRNYFDDVIATMTPSQRKTFLKFGRV